VPADDAPVEKKDRNIESVATLEDWVAIDVDDFDGWQRGRASQGVQLAHHLVAQLTVVTMNDSETWRVGSHVDRLVVRAGLHGVGYKAHRRGRHLAYRRDLVTIDDGRERGR
jgi:hypothetical protein